MRLVTRSDFDGLACAVLLVEAEIVDDYLFVHPKDLQDGKVAVTANDVLANVPYVPGCGLWFDHHSSERERQALGEKFQYKGRSAIVSSCARVIYDFYGGAARFGKYDASGMMAAVDKTDSGQLSLDEILQPQDWVLLSFIMDPRTGLGRYRDYRISNYQLMADMIQYCRTMNAAEILLLPDVIERVTRYFAQEAAYEQMIRESASTRGDILVIDLLDRDEVLVGNRFKEYALFPDQNISLTVMWGYKRQNVVLSCGHSILNRTSQINVGELMLRHGGGGHTRVGTCQVPIAGWERTRDALLDAMQTENVSA